jgi:hypothetical protein
MPAAYGVSFLRAELFLIDASCSLGTFNTTGPTNFLPMPMHQSNVAGSFLKLLSLRGPWIQIPPRDCLGLGFVLAVLAFSFSS